MIIICMGDGLGNQMFHYAFYRSMQYHNPDADIKMDINNVYGQEMHNGFELDRIFPIHRNECIKEEAVRLMDFCLDYNPKYRYKNMRFLIRLLFFKPKKSFYYQTDATIYDERIFQLEKTQSKVFRGNWINEKYFDMIRQELINEFTFLWEPDKNNSQYLEDILNTESVSIHVRRGDYLQTTFCTLEVEYYKECVRRIKKQITNPKFFVFSDDKDYIIQNFSFLDNYIIVDGNSGTKSYIDMYLMTRCKHNVIANSSFSFWGAYLNQNRDKLVFAPAKASPYLLNPFACEDWIKVSKGVCMENKSSIGMKFVAGKYRYN